MVGSVVNEPGTEKSTSRLFESNIRKGSTGKQTIPMSSTQAWHTCPQLQWMWSTSRLLDMLGQSWQPFACDHYNFALPEFEFENQVNGQVWVHATNCQLLTAVHAVHRGNVKWSSQINYANGHGQLRFNAFCKKYLSTYSGPVTTKTLDGDVVSIKPTISQRDYSSFDAQLQSRFDKLCAQGKWRQPTVTD